MAQPVDELTRLVNRELAVRPRTRRGEQLDRIVVLGRRVIFGIHRHVGLRQRGRRIADRFVMVALRDIGAELRLGARRIERGARRLGFKLGVDLVGRLAGRLISIGDDHRDDLSVMPDARRFERTDRASGLTARGEELDVVHAARVFVGEDVEHAGNRARLIQIERGDASLGDRARHQIGVSRIGDRKIRGIARFACHLEAAVDPWRRLTHIGLGLWNRIAHVIAPSAPHRPARAPACVCRALP